MREEDRNLEDRLEDEYGGGENVVSRKRRGLPKQKILSKNISHVFLVKRP